MLPQAQFINIEEHSMKTKEELNALKLECEKMDSKLRELSEDELDLVTGGQNPALIGIVQGLTLGYLFPYFANKSQVVAGAGSLNGNGPMILVDGVEQGQPGEEDPRIYIR